MTVFVITSEPKSVKRYDKVVSIEKYNSSLIIHTKQDHSDTKSDKHFVEFYLHNVKACSVWQDLNPNQW